MYYIRAKHPPNSSNLHRGASQAKVFQFSELLDCKVRTIFRHLKIFLLFIINQNCKPSPSTTLRSVKFECKPSFSLLMQMPTNRFCLFDVFGSDIVTAIIEPLCLNFSIKLVFIYPLTNIKFRNVNNHAPFHHIGLYKFFKYWISAIPNWRRQEVWI